MFMPLSIFQLVFRGPDSVVQGKFLPLDQRKQSSAGEIRMGKRLRRLLCVGIEYQSGRSIYRRTRATSSLAPSPTSSTSSSNDMDCGGRMREAVKTARPASIPDAPV